MQQIMIRSITIGCLILIMVSGVKAENKIYEVDIYGRFKTDAAYDDSRVRTGNYMSWIESETNKKNDNEFDLTANESRIGIKIRSLTREETNTSGRFECDFYGGGAENKSLFMLRHLYMKIEFSSGFEVLAGQTSDVISPLVPETLNYPVAWWAGNIGYRRPQMRVSKGLVLGGDNLLIQAALARPIGRNDFMNTANRDSGSDSGVPHLQVRGAWDTKLFKDQPATLGISAHRGREEYDLNVTGDAEHYATWSFNLDFKTEITGRWGLKLEAFVGKNLDAYLGGIGQGINLLKRKEIADRGGWLDLCHRFDQHLRFNLGYSIDQPDKDDLNNNDRKENTSLFANALYQINQSTLVGLELSRWETDYVNQEKGNNSRAQLSFIFYF